MSGIALIEARRSAARCASLIAATAGCRACAMTSGTAASFAGRHDMYAGDSRMAASASINSTQMRVPSAAGSAACSSRSTISSGMIVPRGASFIPACRLAERNGAMHDQEIKRRVVSLRQAAAR